MINGGDLPFLGGDASQGTAGGMEPQLFDDAVHEAVFSGVHKLGRAIALSKLQLLDQGHTGRVTFCVAKQRISPARRVQAVKLLDARHAGQACFKHL